MTGWIPERVALKSSDEEFNKEALFKKLLERFHRGDVLVTVATGEMSDAEAERSGLVSAHAYALLDIREVKVRLQNIYCFFFVWLTLENLRREFG